ncbi:uncharacterized protein SCODWIG_02031 [Saccharomycodes ludwigii]|uniref:Suppressor of lethality of KEX2 GAS1 double null mutant protein 1 n=2 Tax=Saccharomycodes ludwigii TaxID=36035 RepID=A0A376B821_9ASCO|nr:uncharacterized protein SCODWIG_02031 [Saccharomycodes ludwigii]
MGTSTSVTVGCAIGIPCAVAVVLALAFWIKMQERFKKELREDDGHSLNGDLVISNINDLKEYYNNNNNSTQQMLDDTDDHKTDSIIKPNNTLKRSSSSRYVPAYRRNMVKNMYEQYYPTNFNSNEELKLGNHTDNSTENINNAENKNNPPENNKQHMIMNNSILYDTYVPIFKDTDKDSIALDTLSKDPEQQHHTSQLTTPYTSTENMLVRNLNSQDYGNYYPRHPSTSSHNLQKVGSYPSLKDSSSITRHNSYKMQTKSSIRNLKKHDDNVSSTTYLVPDHTSGSNSSKIRDNFNDKRESIFDDENQISDNLSIQSSLRENSNPVIGPVGDHNIEQASTIEEEDQYENDYTNYSQNKKDFIDS